MTFRYLSVFLLLIIYLVIWLYWKLSLRRKTFPIYSEKMDLILTKNLDKSKVKFKNSIITLALVLLTIAASGPQIGTRVRPLERRGVDLVIALDTSISMNAEDVTPSRLKKAKLELGRLISNLKGDRISIIVFAGTSHLYLPLTTDYEAALLFLNEIDSNMIPTQGTLLSTAMNTAIETFTDETDKFKVMLLVSDGEDHDDEAIKIATKASDLGLMINTVGVGSKSGSLIPIIDKNKKKTYKRNKKGNLITSILNDSNLKEIATAGEGSYFWFSNSSDSYKEIITEIESMEKKTIATHEFSEFEDRYQIIALFSLLCLLFGFLTPTIKK